MCPARCDISFVIDLLADKGRQYKTTGLRRSALLAFHDPIKIGDHPRASDFMSGLFIQDTHNQSTILSGMLK